MNKTIFTLGTLVVASVALAACGGGAGAGGSTPPVQSSPSSNQASSPSGAIVLTIAAANPGPYLIGSTATFTASGTDNNGKPYSFTPSFSLDNAAVGTIKPSASNPNAATVTFGTAEANGDVVVTDKSTGATGKLQVSVLSQRPASGGDTYTFTGSLTQTFNRTFQTPMPGQSPMPVSSTTTNVTQSILVKSGTSYQGQSGLYDFALSETDVTPLKTSTSTSDSYYGFGANGASELNYGSQWADESGDTLATTYPTPLIVDELPETQGAQWTNAAAASIYENISNDSSGQALTSHRVYNADGTYTEATTYPPGYILASLAQSTITENPDGSGSYMVPAAGGFLNFFGFSAPSTAQSATPTITVNVYYSATPAPGAPPDGVNQVPAWYPPKPTLYSESDVDNGLQTLPQTCKVPAAFGTQAMQLVQTINRLDTVLGYTDVQTTTSYVVNGFGPVCVQLNDLQTDYYDFNDDGSLFTPNGQPLQTTTTAETLTLQQNGTSVIGTMKSQSATRKLTTALIHAAGGRFAFAVDHVRLARERAFAHTAASRLIRNHGGQ